MGSKAISTTPSRTFDWADDEEDDFDFDAWKANAAHISAPSLEELGPLQLPPDEDCTLITVAPKSSAPEAQQTPSPDTPELPENIETFQLEEIDGSGFQFFHMIEERLPDPPAYPELSAYDDDTSSPYIRTNYTNHWTAMKAKSGQDFRIPVLYKRSWLSKVQCAYEEDIEISEGEVLSAQCDKVPCDEEEVACDPQFPTRLSPIINIKDIHKDAQDAHTTINTSTQTLYDELSKLFPNSAISITHEDFDFADIFSSHGDEASIASSLEEGCLSNTPPSSRDEAYASESPPPSSLETEKERKQNPLAAVSQPIMVRFPPTPTPRIEEHSDATPHHEATAMERKDSMDALDEGAECAVLAIEPTTQDEPEEKQKLSIASGSQQQIVHELPTLYSAYPSQFVEEGSYTLPTLLSDASPDKDVALLPPPATQTASSNTNTTNTMSEYISKTISTGWSTLSSRPWTAVGIATAGIMAGSLIHFARRR